MPAYKNKENGSWYVVTQYTDWTGERKPKCKRGFATRREALEWEQKFQQQSAGDLDMSFEAFCEIYTNDLKARLKESTWQTKENILTAVEYRRAIAGRLLLGNCDRSVPRSCCWRTRQSIA